MKGIFRATSGEIASITGGRIIAGDENISLETVTTDSRELGDNNLFIPITGEKFDGHDFIPELFKSGKISCSLTMKEGFETAAAESGKSLIKCDDTLAALGKIAEFYRNRFSPLTIGITGTNGKTTTKELVYSVLSAKYNTLRNTKNYNNEIGVPFTLLQMDSSHEAAVIEMGMNHTGEIERLSNIVQPDIAVITNVGAGHLEFLGSVENVANAKSEILSGMKRGSTLIANRETECFHIIEKHASEHGVRLLTFGIEPGADFRPDSFKLTRSSVDVVYKGKKISVPLYGRHNVYNLMAAIAVAETAGVDLADAAAKLSSFENVGGRSEIIDRGFVLINDTYNSNPLSSLYALESVCDVFPDRKKTAVLADMKELGELAGLYHMKVGEFVAARKFNQLLLFGDMSEYYEKGASAAGMNPDKIKKFDSKDQIAEFLLSGLCEKDVVLVKGSRSMKMEDVVNRLIA
ncbi:MAG TPA: UDP-N-acetylmuramoyl-tripeptide--D-alanyl-D-alanine ligase [Spirochaetota bacterium]|nr:UDP-N-acetylmuramoyl-tripeptide--D-alanyl-D-alanine ligase [Spirochaetota bacterium]